MKLDFDIIVDQNTRICFQNFWGVRDTNRLYARYICLKATMPSVREDRVSFIQTNRPPVPGARGATAPILVPKNLQLRQITLVSVFSLPMRAKRKISAWCAGAR